MPKTGLLRATIGRLEIFEKNGCFSGTTPQPAKYVRGEGSTLGFSMREYVSKKEPQIII
jgi:hypothetical protein